MLAASNMLPFLPRDFDLSTALPAIYPVKRFVVPAALLRAALLPAARLPGEVSVPLTSQDEGGGPFTSYPAAPVPSVASSCVHHRDIPAAVLVTTRDRLIRPARQRELAVALGAHVLEIDADHDLPLSSGREYPRLTRLAVDQVAPHLTAAPSGSASSFSHR
jgi:hypothetical protein